MHLPLAGLDSSNGAWSLWQAYLLCVDEVSVDKLGHLAAVAKRVSARARRKELQSSLEDFRAWIATAPAVGILHKSLANTPSPPREVSVEGKVFFAA